jgi:hypothetical protein
MDWPAKTPLLSESQEAGFSDTSMRIKFIT